MSNCKKSTRSGSWTRKKCRRGLEQAHIHAITSQHQAQDPTVLALSGSLLRVFLASVWVAKCPVNEYSLEIKKHLLQASLRTFFFLEQMPRRWHKQRHHKQYQSLKRYNFQIIFAVVSEKSSHPPTLQDCLQELRLWRSFPSSTLEKCLDPGVGSLGMSS